MRVGSEEYVGSAYKWKTAKQMILGKSVPNEQGCWIWVGSKHTKGYGNIQASIWGRRYRVASAHRLSYIAFNGDFDRELLVCHRCHTPECCNPEHLYLGTNADNMQDKAAQGSAKGSRNPNSKLSELQVREIRDLLGSMTNVEIASRYGVDARAISDIKTGRTWATEVL